MGAAVDTKSTGAPAVITRPARGVLARTAFHVPCGARSARRSLVDDFRPASAAKPPRAPFGVELPFRHPAFFAARLADGAALHGLSFAAGRAQPGFGAFAPSPPAPLARHAPAALWIAPAISRSLKPGPLVSGAFGGPASFEAGVAETSPGRRAVLPAFNAQTHGAAFLHPPPVAFALINSPSLRVPVWHGFLRALEVRRPATRRQDVLRAEALPRGDFLTSTASCPTRGVRPTVVTRSRGCEAPCRR